MNPEFLIIGQGICGSWLSYWLQQEKRSFLLIDDNDPHSPSRISAGVINPVTGRRHVSVWMAEDLLPFAKKHYQQWGRELSVEGISEKTLVDFFPSPQMRESFLKRTGEYGEYVKLPRDENNLREHFNYDFGYGLVSPVYTAHLENLLPAWRQRLAAEGKLREEEFDIGQLEINSSEIRYKDVRASIIIFCDGNTGKDNPWFAKLPFALNKGELVLAHIPGLSTSHIYKKTLALVPLAEKDQWWIGSNYIWEFEDRLPSVQFRKETEAHLKKWLKIPVEIISHLAGLRPATVERRPFVGLHPIEQRIGILNGMGSKGASLAPYFAKQLADHLVHGTAITGEADVRRFSRLLSQRS